MRGGRCEAGCVDGGAGEASCELHAGDESVGRGSIVWCG